MLEAELPKIKIYKEKSSVTTTKIGVMGHIWLDLNCIQNKTFGEIWLKIGEIWLNSSSQKIPGLMSYT